MDFIKGEIYDAISTPKYRLMSTSDEKNIVQHHAEKQILVDKTVFITVSEYQRVFYPR